MFSGFHYFLLVLHLICISFLQSNSGFIGLGKQVLMVLSNSDSTNIVNILYYCSVKPVSSGERLKQVFNCIW